MKRPTFSRTAILVLLLLFGLQLFAQNYVPFTPRYDEDIKGDIVELQGEVKSLSRSIRSVSKAIETHEVDFHGDPLAKFKN